MASLNKKTKQVFLQSSTVLRLSSLTKQKVSIPKIKDAVVRKCGELIFFFNPTPDFVFFLPRNTKSNAIRPGMEIIPSGLRADFTANLLTASSGFDPLTLELSANPGDVEQLMEDLSEIVALESWSKNDNLDLLTFKDDHSAALFHMAWQSQFPNNAISFSKA